MGILKGPTEKLGQEVAVALGLGWSARQSQYEWRDSMEMVNSTTGAVIQLTINMVHQGVLGEARVEAAGVYGPGLSQHLPYHQEPRSDISVAYKRGAQAVAGEIIRRLLPVYLPRLNEARERKQKADEFEAARMASIERLAAILGTEPRERGINRYFKDMGEFARVDVDMTTASHGDVKLNRIPTELIVEVLKMVKGYKPERGANDTSR